MLTELQLKDFRCFDSLGLRLHERYNFFVGPNGAGKTSILEAACVLLRLQSQRSSSLVPLIRAGAKSFGVSGEYAGHLLKFQYGKLRRHLEFDETEQRTVSDYLRLARVVSFANTDIELVRGSSEPRRRYLDFIGAQIHARYRPILRAYERALRSRNALLKTSPVRLKEIAAYDRPLIDHGTELGKLRAEIVQRLAPLVNAACGEISNKEDRAEVQFAPGNQEDFAADLDRTRDEQIRLRQTVVGPHRDDLALFVDGMAAQVYASEGQQRTLALALKLGQVRLFAEAGAAPMLLIDDIFGELDPVRRKMLFSSLPDGAQKLVTSTTVKWPEEPGEHKTFQLHDGRIG